MSPYSFGINDFLNKNSFSDRSAKKKRQQCSPTKRDFGFPAYESKHEGSSAKNHIYLQPKNDSLGKNSKNSSGASLRRHENTSKFPYKHRMQKYYNHEDANSLDTKNQNRESRWTREDSRAQNSPLKFRSTKVQSQILLQNLASQLTLEIEATDHLIKKVDAQLNIQLLLLTPQKLESIQENILSLINEVFQGYREYLHQTQRRFQKVNLVAASQDMRENLKKLKGKSNQISYLRKEMDKNWRNIIGFIISGNIEEKVQETIQKSECQREAIQIGLQSLEGLKFQNSRQSSNPSPKIQKRQHFHYYSAKMKQLVENIIQQTC